MPHDRNHDDRSFPTRRIGESRKHTRENEPAHYRPRSRSPPFFHEDDEQEAREKKERDRSSRHHHSHSHRSHRHKSRDRESRSHSPSKHRRDDKEVADLPNNAPHISTRHYGFYEGLFASYLDVQKGIRLDDLDERERRGRFKSFVKHWNRGELANGWYDPDRKQKCDALRAEILGDAVPQVDEGPSNGKKRRASPVYESRRTPPPPQRSESSRQEKEERQVVRQQREESESDDEGFGPWIPGQERKGRVLPTLPSAADLDAQSEAIREAHRLERADLNFHRKQDRKAQKERLDELVPRTDAGTRERQIEKKKEVNDKMREFRNKSPGAELEVEESTLMGDNTEDSFKARKAAMERKKNERELRKEAMLRARIQEREERLDEARKKEEKTMSMLKALRDNMLQKQRY